MPVSYKRISGFVWVFRALPTLRNRDRQGPTRAGCKVVGRAIGISERVDRTEAVFVDPGCGEGAKAYRVCAP